MAKIKKLTRVTTYVTHGESYKICVDSEGKYWGIRSEDIENGILLSEYNGISGHRSDTVEEVMKSLDDKARVHELVQSGVNPSVATIVVSSNRSVEEVIELLKASGCPEEFYK